MNRQQTIGELPLHSFGGTTKHEVNWVHGYGVTCASLFTSNGNLFVVARGLESYLDVAHTLADIPDRRASLVLDGQVINAGQVENALKASCTRANEIADATAAA